MEFAFTALDKGGARVAEHLQAQSYDEAVSRLQNRGLVVLSLEAASGGKRAAPPRAAGGANHKGVFALLPAWPRRGVKLEQVVALSRELAIMIETGVPITEAILSLAEHAEAGLIRDALVEVHRSLSEGRTVGESLQAQPHVFPPLYRDMVRTAEVGGNLDETLNQAADYLEASLEMRRKVQGALTYPAVLLFVMGAVVVFMVVFLVPRFGAMFQQMGATIPLQMKVMLAVSAFLRRRWFLLPPLLGASVIGMRLFLRSPGGRQLLARGVLKIPVVGDTVRKIAIARTLRALGTLLGSGVSILTALETVSKSAQNIVFEEAILKVRGQVETGVSMTEAAQETKVFPPMVCQMIAVGEKSGRLNTVLLHVARFYERAVDMRLRTLATVIEPVMIVLLGLVVGFLAVSIFGPMYSLYDNVK